MLTREQAETIYEAGPEAVIKALVELSARVVSLEEKLAPKPHTPSAAQGFLKPMLPVSQRQKTGKKSGGQKGHPGHTLPKSVEPDQIEEHRPQTCPECGLSLQGVPGAVAETRHLMDLPEGIRFFTVEHQAVQVCCPGCHGRIKADFPAGVLAPVQYGPVTQAICTQLKMEQAISLERIVSLLTDWFGHAPSEGTIQNWIALAAVRLEPIENKIKAGIIQADSAGFDETMVRSAKKNAWIHVARTRTLSYFSVPGGRGKAAMEAAGILPHFRGVAHHDAWRAYMSFAGCSHSLCVAHLLREGVALQERFDAKGVWSEPILSWLRALKKQKESGHLSDGPTLVNQFRALVYKAYHALGLAPPVVGKPLCACSPEMTSRVRWLDRLWSYAREVTRFGWDARAEFDNNGSERDLRPVKLFAKVFGCWRSSSGLGDFCRLRGYLSTLRKQGMSSREGLLSVFRGEPICPAIA